MSLLADLLSKLKPPQTTREIPPNLKNIVQSSAQRSASRRRIVLLSVLISVAVLAGVFLVYFTKTLSERSDSSITAAPQKSVAPDEQNVVSTGIANEIASPADPSRKGGDPVSPAIPSRPATQAEKKEDATGSGGEKIISANPVQPSVSGRKPAKGADMLPSLEQVIVKKENPVSQIKVKDEPALDAYLYSARDLELKNDFHGAMNNYKKVLEIDKNNFTAMNNIAYLSLRTGSIEEAMKYSQMALEVNKDHVPSIINLGIASARANNIDDAEAYFMQALSLDRNNQDVLINLALLNERQANYQKAVEYYSALVKYGNISGTLGLARIYEKQDNSGEALRLYRSAYADSSLDEKTRAEVKQRIIVLLNKAQKPDIKAIN